MKSVLALDSYLACERLYVDELMGGRLNRYFSSVLEHVAPEPETRASVIRLLCEAAPEGKRPAQFESWRRRLKLDSAAVEQLVRLLHIQELINCDGETIDITGSSTLWQDYLKSRFRLDALREPRALVVADVMADALKAGAANHRASLSPRRQPAAARVARQIQFAAVCQVVCLISPNLRPRTKGPPPKKQPPVSTPTQTLYACPRSFILRVGCH